MDDFIYQIKLSQFEVSKEKVDTNILKLEQQISALEAFKGYLK